MHNNEFEKRVEQKLEELKFTPSDAVWQKVEAQIKQPERRRRFIFWWFTVAVLILGFFAWGIFLKNTNPEMANASIGTKNKIQYSSKSRDDFKLTNPIVENYPIAKEGKEQPINQIKVSVSSGNSDKNSSYKRKKPELVFADEINGQQKNKSKLNAKISVKKIEPIKDDITTVQSDVVPSVNKNKEPIYSVESNEFEKYKDTFSVAKSEPNIVIEIKTTTSDSIETKINKTTFAKIAKSKSNKNKIEIALNFKVGIFGISSFKDAFKLADMLSTTSNFTNQNYPSKALQGAGFGAGIQMKKWFTKRFAFSVGLEYSFYTSSIKTGNTVDSTARFTSNAGTVEVNRVYKNGTANTFVNRYHFIEVPLMLQWQINKIGNRPIYLNGGIAYCFLASSNAIYFDSGADNYYYSKSLFNRSQFQLRTGIAMGMIKKLNYPLTIGLQYQYNLSGQWQKSLDLNQHLSFTGIQLSWRLNKN